MDAGEPLTVCEFEIDKVAVVGEKRLSCDEKISFIKIVKIYIKLI